MSPAGRQKQVAPINGDGEFSLGLGVHPEFGDYVVVVSMSHPLVTMSLPASPQDELTMEWPSHSAADLKVDAHQSALEWSVGLEIDGMPVPTDALFRHQSLRGSGDRVPAGGELLITDLAPAFGVDVYAIPPVHARPPEWGGVDPMQEPALRSTLKRYPTRNGAVVFDSVP
jgi:hypothetical protein